MKTFEERYTAWIDGELEGNALTAFEQELTRRAAAGEAAEDKSDATRLRALLQDHLQAPVLTNPDFFSHQLRERIDAETAAVSRGREPNRHAEPTFFAWGLARLIGLGAASLFAAAALYYGMMPPHIGSLPTPAVAVNHATAGNGTQVAVVDTPAPSPQPAATENHPAAGMGELALRSPTPSPIDLTSDIKVYVPDQPANPTTITPLHYDKSNVNGLWLNGLDHLPSLPDATGNAPAPAPSVAPNPQAAGAAQASPGAVADALHGALILATNSEPPTPVPEELRGQVDNLRAVFGYKKFRLLNQKRKAVPTGAGDWLAPSR